MSRSRFLTAVIFVIFFVMSILTNILGPLIPEIIRAYGLSLTMAAFLPFSFFVAYGVMSIPAGMITEKKGEKFTVVGAFVLALAGCLLFALVPLYPTALLSLFLIGLGMAALQVAINPLLRVTGGEENYAFNAVIVQFVFGTGSFLSPSLYTHFVDTEHGDALSRFLATLVPPNLPWLAVYWVLTILIVVMLALLVPVRFPTNTMPEESSAFGTPRSLLRNRTVWAYFIAIFAYVGLEQGLSNWMSEFLAAQHGLNPQTDGAASVSRFWLLMTAGAGLGMILLKFADSRKVLLFFSFLSFFTLAAAIFGNALVAIVAFPLVGFSISVMWSILFSLALNSMPSHHGAVSGILCTGVIGGAVLPLLIGSLGDLVSLRFGLVSLFVPLAYIFSVGLWSKPLVVNKTRGGKK